MEGPPAERPYLWIDATYLKVRRGGRIVSVAVIIAVGVNSDGRREVLGMEIGTSEAEPIWTEFLRKLTRRGLRGIKPVISFGGQSIHRIDCYPTSPHEGLKAAVARVLCATWQRCRVHFMRNVLAHAGKNGRRVVSAFIATAFAQETPEAASAQWRAVADQIRPKVPKLAAIMDDAETDVLAYMTFPREHRAKLHSTDKIDKRFRSDYPSGARVTSWRSAVHRLQAPSGSLLKPCRVEVPARLVLGWARVPGFDEVLVARLGLPGDLHLLVPQFLYIIGVGGTSAVSLRLRPAGLQFHASNLMGDETGTSPQVILLLRQHMPDEHRQLARHGDRGYLVAAFGPDADEEGVQRPWRFRRSPGSLDKHGAGVAPADLANAPMMCGAETRLSHTRVETKVADQSLRGFEPGDIADRRHQSSRHRQIDAGDGEQPSDRGINQRVLGNLSVKDCKILTKSIQFAHMPLDRNTFIARDGLAH